MNKKRIIKIIFGVFALSLIASVIMGYLGIKNYLDRVPVITPKENITVTNNSTITFSDIAEVTPDSVVQESIYSACWAKDESTSGLEIRDGKLIITEGNGICNVTITATGNNSESRDALVTIEIIDK